VAPAPATEELDEEGEPPQLGNLSLGKVEHPASRDAKSAIDSRRSTSYLYFEALGDKYLQEFVIYFGRERCSIIFMLKPVIIDNPSTGGFFLAFEPDRDELKRLNRFTRKVPKKALDVEPGLPINKDDEQQRRF
jgi:hypothetical protein